MTSFGKALLVSFLFFLTSQVKGQFYSQGEDPASVKWEKIKTENFSLIYPRGFYAEANRFANLLEYYRPYSSYSLNNMPGRIPVIIHTQSVNSNGFVTWAPRRMEVFALADQNNFAQDWFEQLALHEYRHAVQINKFHQGITRGISWIFGEMATGATSAYMPRWFLEGDAVVNETVVSSTGRGRLPSFDMELRAAVLDPARKFSYDQAFMGTYKYFIPDLYQYGYHMVSYARIHYGSEFWEKAINYSARNPYLLAPLSLYSLKHIGLNRAQLYKKAMDSVRIIWNSHLSDIRENDYTKIINKKTNSYQQYKLPQSLSDKSYIALKTGIDLLDQIVRIDSTGKETKLLEIGSSKKINLSASNDYIIWDEIVGDPRWKERSYSVIKSFNIHTKNEKQLTRKTRYFSPDISNDETKIVAVETDIENNNFLILLQYPGGELLKRIPSPENKIMQFPEWISEKQVVLVTFDGKEKSIETVDIENGEWQILFNAGTMDVAEPSGWRQYVLFRASYNGIENIFAVGPEGRLFQITSSVYGAFHPSVSFDACHLVYSNYTPDGFELAMIPLDTNQWIPVQSVRTFRNPWSEELKKQEMTFENRDNNTFHQYRSAPYNKSANLFKFHSWLPFYMDLDENNLSLDYQTVRPGLMLFSQNLLSTAFSTLSYRYDEGYNIFKPSFTFKGWYPVFNIIAELGGPVSVLPFPENIQLPEIRSYRKIIRAKTYVPLFFTNGRYLKLIQPQLEYEWSNAIYYNGLFKSGIQIIHARFYCYRYLRSSLRDLYPKWGQFLSLTYTDTPSDDEQLGKLWSAKVDLYFPGLLNHHSLRLEPYLPINRIAFPRGYVNYIAEEFMKVSANYSFPLIYPDFSLSWLLYIKRMTVNLFYDTSYGVNILEVEDGNGDSYTGIYNSTGMEFFADLHLFRIMFPIRAGIRYSYLPVRNSHDVEFLFTIDTDIF
jgi:hypothetical protein